MSGRDGGEVTVSSYIVRLVRDHASAPLWSAAPAPREAPVEPDATARREALQGCLESAARDAGLGGVILREAVEQTIERGRTRTSQYRRSLSGGPTTLKLEDVPTLPSVGRADLAARPEAFVPDDQDLAGMAIVRAPIPGAPAALVPQDAFAPLAEVTILLAALRRRGISIELAPDLLALVRIDRGAAGDGARPRDAAARPSEGPAWPDPEAPLAGPAWPSAEGTPADAPAEPAPARVPAASTVSKEATEAGSTSGRLDGSGALSLRAVEAVSAVVGAPPMLGGAGFLRFDLSPKTWRHTHDPVRLLAAFAPAVVAGTTAALEEMVARAEDLQRGHGAGAPRMRVKAVLVTGGALTRPLRERIEKAFTAPAIEWYGVPEAGPIAYGCPAGRGLHVLPPDLLVESHRDTGELALTGGRNRFLPLVRYRPGDRGKVEAGPCSCGDRSPRIVGLERA